MAAFVFADVLEAFEFVSFADEGEHMAWLALDTGEVHWQSDALEGDVELPEDLETSDRYVAVPHERELDLGRSLALRFAAEQMPGAYARVQALFHGRGAFGRFKALLESEGLLQRWYDHEAAAEERALREWCAENGIDLSGERAPTPRSAADEG